MARAPRRCSIAAVLALSGLVAGCSGAEDPVEPAASETAASEPAASESTPTVSEPSALPSSSPSAAGAEKPERPAAMDQHDAEGAAAAAEYFLSLYNYTKDSGDTTEWRLMSHEACDFCQNVLKRAVEIREAQLEIEGGELSFQIREVYQRDSATGLFPLDVEVTQESSKTTRPDGSIESETEGQSGMMRMEMGLRGGDWVVATVAPLPED